MDIAENLKYRFGAAEDVADLNSAIFDSMVGRASCRSFSSRDVAPALLRSLCAVDPVSVFRSNKGDFEVGGSVNDEGSIDKEPTYLRRLGAGLNFIEGSMKQFNNGCA